MFFTLHGLKIRLYGHSQPWKVDRGEDCPEPISIKACKKDHVSGFTSGICGSDVDGDSGLISNCC